MILELKLPQLGSPEDQLAQCLEVPQSDSGSGGEIK